jgi:formylglycine-generating enzyme required for sulfatase activity
MGGLEIPQPAARIGAALAMLALPALAQTIDFARDVAPILEEQCLACHSATKAAGGLALIGRQALIDKKAIVPNKPEASPLYILAALPSTTAGAMPPGGPLLSAGKLATLKDWIAQGAPWPKGMGLRSSIAVSPAGEHETVRRIRQQILDHQKNAPGGGKYSVTIPNSTVTYDLAPIPAGEFLMGSPDSDPQRKPDEQPRHKVRVDAFWIQTHEVTWDEYRLFMFSHQAGKIATADSLVDAVAGPTCPYVEMSFGMGIDGFPAISMTQHAANKYAEWLSAKTGEFYRLPTEAEWEYACRAGASTPFYFGAGPAQLPDHSWFAANSEGKYRKVASKPPSPWGLYDMLGNVMEWTLDQYAPYSAAPQTNPWVPPTAPYPQVARGGSWNDPADSVRCAARVPSDASWKQQDPQLPKSIWYLTDAQWLGFRLVRPAKVPSAEELYRYWNNGVEHDER